MNWIKSTDRLPEDLPEYAGRKAIKCLVAYQSCGHWQWTTMLRRRSKHSPMWVWSRNERVGYWCIPENPYTNDGYELGKTTLHGLYYNRDIDADVTFTVKNAQGETIYEGDYDELPSAMESRGVLKYRPGNMRAGFYHALEVWLA